MKKSHLGKKLSETTKEKIRQSALNKPPVTEEARKNMRENSAKYWLNKQRLDMRKPIKSKWREFRRQLSGRTEYKQWRTIVFQRDNYTCQMCGAKSGEGKTIYLEAHHILSARDFPQLILDIDNGITFCRECHRKLNGRTKITN